MFRLFLALLVGGLVGTLGYVLGAALTDNLPFSLACGGVGFAIGFGIWMAISTKAAQDEHPMSSR